MKKILSFLLALALLLSIAGCGETSQPQVLQSESSYTETTAPTQAPTEETQTQPTQQETEATHPAPTETKPAPKPTEPKPTEPKPTVAPETEPTEQPTEPAPTETAPPQTEPEQEQSIDSKEEVSLYIHLHGKLPPNYITKSQARKLGWKSGSVERYAPGKCIGGDRFMNREGLLPAGHTYYECDIDTLGASGRGAKRLVYSSDGLIYYTADHYASFTLLYGTP